MWVRRVSVLGLALAHGVPCPPLSCLGVSGKRAQDGGDVPAHGLPWLVTGFSHLWSGLCVEPSRPGIFLVLSLLIKNSI